MVMLVVLIVLQTITKAAATTKTVGAVAKVTEETVPLGPHLGGEIRILLIHEIIVSISKKGHRLYREGESIGEAFVIEPLHESFLKP